MLLIKRSCIVFIVVLLSVSFVNSQDNNSPLLDLLATIPDTDEIRESIISYIDYRAIKTTREGVPQYDSWADFLEDSENPSSALWLASIRGVSSGPSILDFLFVTGEEWQDTIGLEFFDINQAITYGTPPAQGQALIGNFNIEDIEDAFAERDYVAEDVDNFTLLCWEEGCDRGIDVDIQNQVRANPFGGNLGRREPLLVNDNLLINAPAIDIVEASLDIINDGEGSLADNPVFLSALNTIDENHTLIQAQFLPADIFVASDDMQSQFDTSIPHYEQALFADTAGEEAQIVYIVMVYDNLADAEMASETALARLENMESTRGGRPFADIFEERGVTELQSYAVTDADSELSLAVLEIHAPLVSNEETDSGFLPSSPVFRTFITMIYNLDLAWLMTSDID